MCMETWQTEWRNHRGAKERQLESSAVKPRA